MQFRSALTKTLTSNNAKLTASPKSLLKNIAIHETNIRTMLIEMFKATGNDTFIRLHDIGQYILRNIYIGADRQATCF